ncbi:MAG TPA: tannase/feruloyl esterase family alpha/beta hydrolase [Candidatus Acidoferrales bacterium]|nr:tannase/feruloyl esterase family alpha/beta hydrolase [Candidatus Acidoferrales bacterium]
MRIKERSRQHAHSVALRCGMVAFACVAFGQVSAWADCTTDSVNALHVANMSIASATLVPAAPPNPEFCDVKGTVTTTGEGAGDGSANFEVMLPARWNQKFIFHGVGGLAGTMTSSANPADQQLFLPRGYATAITDTGHLVANPTWEYTAPGAPDMPKVIDYYYRAVHEVTLAAKMLVKSYYRAETIRRSYFDGCSNGGKMGMMEAGRYPADYDGIISGSPWLDPVGTSLWSVKNIKALLDAYIPVAKFQAVSAAILKQCDKLDGVADGLIQNPAKCAFQPDALVPEALTQKQADALKMIMNPVRDEQGKIIFPGASVGNLGQDNITVRGATNYLDAPPADPGAAKPWGDGTLPANWSLAQNILMKLGYYDAGKDMNNEIESNGVVKTDALNLVYTRMADDIPNDPSKLSAYFSKGGKLLIYHGFDDLIISPYSSIWFYEDLAQENGGYPKLQQSARLFMVPGMQHCVLGAGPNSFDTLTAMEQWVEKGIAPDAIPATHLANNVPDRTMPLCKFPEQAHYKGSGDPKSVGNWSCPQNDKSLLTVGPNGIQAGVNAAPGARVRPVANTTAKSGNGI